MFCSQTTQRHEFLFTGAVRSLYQAFGNEQHIADHRQQYSALSYSYQRIVTEPPTSFVRRKEIIVNISVMQELAQLGTRL